MQKRYLILLLAALTACKTTTNNNNSGGSNDTIVFNPKPSSTPPSPAAPAPATSAIADSAAATSPIPQKESSKIASREAQNLAEPTAKLVLAAIAQKDMPAWAAFVHPEKGVRFSPYQHVDTKTDRIVKASQLAKATADTKTYNWGVADGSGEPIILTFDKYYQRFIYNYDYQKLAKQRGFNRSIGSGNSINNIKTVYPNGIAVEYYVPGQNPDYGGMDWGSLTLVFEPTADNKYYLVGVIHGQWTS